MFETWVEEIPLRRQQQLTSVFLPGKSHGQKGLVGYSPWGCKELDILSTHTPLTLANCMLKGVLTFTWSF